MRYLILVAVLFAFIAAGSAFQQEEFKPKNLKVLPKNISHDELDSIMHGYNKALNVKCNFCHTPSTADPKKLDFASDKNKHKIIARDMIKMTAKINSKYFKDEKDKAGNPILVVNCITCHNGKKHPEYKQ